MALNVEKAVVPSPPPTLFMFQWHSLWCLLALMGMRDAGKGLSFLHWLSHLSPSVVCLQETHALSSSCFLVHLVPFIRVVLQSCTVRWSFCPC